jgi:S1-C subfamily serine protease
MQYIQGGLQKCTVAIRRYTDAKVLGTGLIVASDGLILTCYHVVGDIKNRTIDEIVDIYFPSTPEVKVHAQPIKQYCDSKLDIAFLQLQEKLPDLTRVADLGDSEDPKEHKFQSFGFRNPEGTIKFEGLPTNGIIQAKTRVKSTNNTITSPRIITLKSDQIDKGMSGAAVLDTETNKIVGIISDHYKSHYSDGHNDNVYKTLSLAIPVESIIQVYPELRERNPGLKKFNNFLKSIGKSGSFIHGNFEAVFVQPIEYGEIERALKQIRCILLSSITGVVRRR